MSERDAAIASMRGSGATYKDIAREFGICAQRARQIAMRARYLESLESDPLYSALSRAASRTGSCEGMAMRTLNVLRRSGYWTLDDVLCAADGELRGARNVGPASMALIREVKADGEAAS